MFVNTVNGGTEEVLTVLGKETEVLGVVELLEVKMDGFIDSFVKEAVSLLSLEVEETPKLVKLQLGEVDKLDGVAFPNALNISPPFNVLPTLSKSELENMPFLLSSL